MRFKRRVIAVSLTLVLALGGYSLLRARHVSDTMLSALEQVRIAVASGDWGDAKTQADTLHNDWHDSLPGLQIFLSHRETDAVDLTLVRLVAALGIEDHYGVARELGDADTLLRNLFVRETPFISNIL